MTRLILVFPFSSKFALGIPFKEVLISGSMERLNAILMTAFTSTLGLALLVADSGLGKEILQPLSIVVLGGLFTSTALTLVVLPAMYAKFGKILLPKQTMPFGEDEKSAAAMVNQNPTALEKI